MRHRLGTVLAAALTPALLLTAGCGEQDSRPPDGSAAATDPAPPAAEPTTEPTPEPAPTTEPTTPPSGALEKTRVVGRVEDLGDCLVVRDDNDTTWTITGPLTGDLVVDDRVQVTGTPDIVAMGCGGPVVKATRVMTLPPAE